MTKQENAVEHFQRLKQARREHDDEMAKIARVAEQERMAKEEKARADSEKHHRIINDVVVKRLDEIAGQFAPDAYLLTTLHSSNSDGSRGTGITISLSSEPKQSITARRTSLYYIKIGTDGIVRASKSNINSTDSILHNAVGMVKADDLDKSFVDAVVKLISAEWFESDRLGL